MKDFEYYGLFLDEETKDKLRRISWDWVWKNIDDRMVINHEFTVYLDHCTLLHKSQKSQVSCLLEANLNAYEGTEVKMIINGIGYSNKAVAFKVELSKPISVNKTPHITIATFNGGKPVDSNYITDWKPLDEPIKIIGTLKRI